MTSKLLKKLAADSNVLLSAVIGKSALKIFTHYALEISTTQFNIEEVKEYLPRLAFKYALSRTSLLLQLSMLPVEIHEESHYKSKMPEAHKYLGARYPDDVHLAALALIENLPIWSNDKDFHAIPLPIYSTAKLLKLLEGK